MPTMLASQIRSVLGRHRIYDVARRTDRQLEQAFERLIDSSSLRELQDIEVGLEYCSDFAGDGARRRILMEAVINRLKFTTPPDRGILYSGRYSFNVADNCRMGTSTPGRLLSPQGISLGSKIAQYAKEAVKMSDVAERWAASKDKWTIAHTAGGRWLNARPLKRLIGNAGYDAIWSMASAKYVKALAGKVDIFLAFPDLAGVFRSTEGHLLYKNPAVTDITYYLEHGPSRVSFPDLAILTSEKKRPPHAHGKQLFFMFPGDSPTGRIPVPSSRDMEQPVPPNENQDLKSGSKPD